MTDTASRTSHVKSQSVLLAESKDVKKCVIAFIGSREEIAWIFYSIKPSFLKPLDRFVPLG